MRPKVFAVGVVMLALQAAAGAAQTGQAGGPVAPLGTPSPTIQVQSQLVLVPTLVLDAAGGMVPGLQARDFHLTDDGKPQTVTLEAAADRQPVDILVVMQTGGAAPREFGYLRGVPTMLEALAGAAPHRFGVVTFDSQPEEQWDFTPELDEVRDAFTRPRGGDRDAAVLDAVNYGIGELAKTPATHRRVLLLLSQPQDDGSRVPADAVVRHLGENNITILSVTFSPEKRWFKDQMAGMRTANKPYPYGVGGPMLLDTFDLMTPLKMAVNSIRHDAPAAVAELSGGEHLRFEDRRSLDQQLALLANHLPNRYLLSFVPRPETPGMHTLHVEVSGRTAPVRVEARDSYWDDGARP